MSDGADTSRMILVDASVFITLAAVDLVDALLALDGRIVVPSPVANEITDDPARRALTNAVDDGSVLTMDVDSRLEVAAARLGRNASSDDVSGDSPRQIDGDVGLLALALQGEHGESGVTVAVVVTDDKPLRKTCKALSIPLSGSVGVLVHAVERGDLDPPKAKQKLYAMDEVGARLSASLVRNVERLINEADEG